jgi:hypothetical protein
VATAAAAGLISTKYGRNLWYGIAWGKPSHSFRSEHAAVDSNANALTTSTSAKPNAESTIVVEDTAKLVSN